MSTWPDVVMTSYLFGERLAPHQLVAGAEAASLLDLLPPLGQTGGGRHTDHLRQKLSLKWIMSLTFMAECHEETEH